MLTYARSHTIVLMLMLVLIAQVGTTLKTCTKANARYSDSVFIKL